MEKKPITTAEIILFTLVLGSADAFEFISTLIAAVPVIGQVMEFMDFFVGLGASAALYFYLFLFKRMKNYWSLAGGIIDQIPLLNALPLKTITWFVVVLLANKPPIPKIAEKAISKTPVGKIIANV